MPIKTLILSWILALGLWGALAPAANASSSFKEGINYISVIPAQPTDVNPGQIKVVEFFWYGGLQCFALEPYLQSWIKRQPANVVLEQVPAALNPRWDMAARAYYTALQLGISTRANAAIYDAMQVHHLSLATATDYRNLFATRFGISAKQFNDAWDSPSVEASISRAKVLAQRYGVSDMPVLAVNGKWLTGAGYQLHTAQIMNAVNWLVQREQAAVAGNIE